MELSWAWLKKSRVNKLKAGLEKLEHYSNVRNLKNDENTGNDYSLRASQLPAIISRLQTCPKTGSFYPEFTLL